MWGTATSEDNLAVSYQVKHTLTTQSLIILFGIYANERKTYVHTKTCTQMLAAASFMVLKNWKHHESLQHGNGTGKLIQRNTHSRRVYKGMTLTDKKERATNSRTRVDEFKIHTAKSKKPDPKSCI